MLDKTKRCLTVVLFALAPMGFADEAALAELPAEEFLAVARRPFLQDAWARFSGTVQFKKGRRTHRHSLRLAVLMHRDYLRAQFILGDNDVYDVTQAYADDGMSNVQIQPPATTVGASLSDLGVAVEDITFSFLYWDFIEELPAARVRGQTCRVMRLRNPQTFDHVVVYFSSRYVGPLRVEHFRGGGSEPFRWLEFTDFKREGELYYVRAAQLRGEGWKTQVRFADAELSLTAERPPPEDLFAR